jgi:malate dehydrogenase (oxaloacetate-decarboxylating)(NADP+)
VYRLPELDFFTDFARTDYDGPELTKLTDIIDYVKPTALLGLSTLRVCYPSHFLLVDHFSSSLIQNAFTEEVVRAMATLNKRPIIFPLSNPAKLCEVDFEQAVEW